MPITFEQFAQKAYAEEKIIIDPRIAEAGLRKKPTKWRSCTTTPQAWTVYGSCAILELKSKMV
jgi:hypothetical protein